MHNEQAVIAAFVKRSKRDRYREILSNPRLRHKFNFNNGDEFRTLPTSIQNGIGTLAWIGIGHRISKATKV